MFLQRYEKYFISKSILNLTFKYFLSFKLVEKKLQIIFKLIYKNIQKILLIVIIKI